MFLASRWIAWAGLAGGSLRAGLKWASVHTGLPVLFVAAIALVASWHLFRRTMRFAIEVAVAAVLLFVATQLGLLHW